jgi:hypothetical protein
VQILKVFNDRNNKMQNHLSALFFVPDTNYWSVEYYVDVMQSDGNIVPSAIPRGFYYVKTAEELLWCANKVNGTNYDNKINIVLGDNIGKSLDVDLSIDNYPSFSAELKKLILALVAIQHSHLMVFFMVMALKSVILN